MNNKSIVRLSNIIGVVSIILLVYWVFIFISISVFDLKILGDNVSQTFYLSVLGILALMFGSLITNIMFNLTRIADKHNQDDLMAPKELGKKASWGIILSFPLVLAVLISGDYLTSRNKELMLISSAKSIVENNPEKSDKLLNYGFHAQWVKETCDILEIYSRTDSHFPFVTVVVADTIDRTMVYLGFNKHHSNIQEGNLPEKTRFIQSTTQEEREYLDKVFQKNLEEVKFIASGGRYELFYPYRKNGKCMVLHFSESPRFSGYGNK
jgi:hypothetical protein